jgi:uncharacterized membrane protein
MRIKKPRENKRSSENNSLENNNSLGNNSGENKKSPQNNSLMLNDWRTKKSPDNNSAIFPGCNFTAHGFLPPTEILRKYNSVVPGLADRLVIQAEKQTTHRISQEKKLLSANIWKSFIGLVFAFLIGSLGVGGGLYLTFVGFNVIGIVFSSATLVSLVMSFIYGSQYKKYKQNNDKYIT